MKFFTTRNSVSYPSMVMIIPDVVQLNLTLSGDTPVYYSILASRLMGLSPAEYARYCRDVHGAKLANKYGYYPLILFASEAQAKPLVDMLNERVSEWRKRVAK